MSMFKLIANDLFHGESPIIVDDKGNLRMLSPSELLEQRINSLSQAAGQPTTPTLIELEQDARRRTEKK